MYIPWTSRVSHITGTSLRTQSKHTPPAGAREEAGSMAHAPVGSSDGDACRICFEASLPTMQSLAHVVCRVQAARTQSAAEEEEKAPSMVELPDVSATLDESHVCGSGERLAVGLHDCEEDLERLAAATTLAISLSDHGKYAEAEQMQREIHAAQTRVLGAEHPHAEIRGRFGPLPLSTNKVCGGGADVPRGACCAEAGARGRTPRHAENHGRSGQLPRCGRSGPLPLSPFSNSTNLASSRIEQTINGGSIFGTADLDAIAWTLAFTRAVSVRASAHENVCMQICTYDMYFCKNA